MTRPKVPNDSSKTSRDFYQTGEDHVIFRIWSEAIIYGPNSLQDCENLSLKQSAVIIQPEVKFKTEFPTENPSTSISTKLRAICYMLSSQNILHSFPCKNLKLFDNYPDLLKKVTPSDHPTTQLS